MKNILLTCLLLTFGGLILSAQITTLRFGKLVTGQGQVIPDAVVVIEGNRIKTVGSGDKAVPPGAVVTDLRPLTGIPGMIDAHTHITYFWDKEQGSTPWAALQHSKAAVLVYLAQESARKTLECGVTTIRDLGSWDGMDLAMRNLINRGAMSGPRMFVAGHGLHITNRPFDPWTSELDPGLADGVEEVQKVARRELAAGVDWIKMYGSTGSDSDVSGNQTYTYEEMKAAVEVASNAGKRVAIHSYGPAGARDAVRAGATTIEHATDVDAEIFQEMARRGTFYVPTVDHNRYYADHRDEYGYDDAVVAGLHGFIARNLESVRLAIKCNVKIAMGSDALFTGFGENTRELEWFVKAGMTPAQALQTATTNGAALLGMETELGAVAPDFLADIVAVSGDPLADIQVVVKGVRWVMKDGKVVVDKR
ncbi:MAG: amidohydrolase family protein [Saprospiraceae bacterium]